MKFWRNFTQRNLRSLKKLNFNVHTHFAERNDRVIKKMTLKHDIHCIQIKFFWGSSMEKQVQGEKKRKYEKFNCYRIACSCI